MNRSTPELELIPEVPVVSFKKFPSDTSGVYATFKVPVKGIDEVTDELRIITG